MGVFRCLLALLLLQGAANADDALDQAKDHYRKGTTLYDLRRYHEAAKEYEAAFLLKDDPVLLFNIAQAYRFAGEYVDAIASYRSYLRRSPHAPNKAEVEERITEMTRILDERRATETRPPAGLAPPAGVAPPPVKPSAPPPAKPVATAAPPPARPAAPPPAKPAAPPPAKPAPPPKVASVTPPKTAPPPKPVERPAAKAVPPPAKPAAPPPKPAPPPPKPAPPPPKASVAIEVHAQPTPPGRTMLISGATVAAAGVVLIVAGGAMAGLTSSESDKITHAMSGSTFDHSTEARALADQRASIGLFVTGGVLAVAGVVVAVLGAKKGRR